MFSEDLLLVLNFEINQLFLSLFFSIASEELFLEFNLPNFLFDSFFFTLKSVLIRKIFR